MRYQLNGVMVVDTQTGQVFHCTSLDNARMVQACMEQRYRRSLPQR